MLTVHAALTDCSTSKVLEEACPRGSIYIVSIDVESHMTGLRVLADHLAGDTSVLVQQTNQLVVLLVVAAGLVVV